MKKKRKRSAVGEGTAERLARRDELKRRSLPGGGEVWSGPLATEALETMDARAMTLDQSIIVSEDFDPSRATDAALFAHEQYHVAQGDHGAGGHHIHSAEETAARAVEAMVVHRAASGGEAGGGADTRRGDSEQNDAEPQAIDPMGGYSFLRSQGHTHSGVVDELARYVVNELDKGAALGRDRNADKSNWK